MHASSYENMRYCRDRNAAPEVRSAPPSIVLDVGAADYNGSYRKLFPSPRFDYRAADTSAGGGVDIAMDDPYHLPLGEESVDLVISGQALEHAEFFWDLFSEMVRVTRRNGRIFLIVPSAGAEHRYPVDCYRFYPDSMRALARYTHTHLVDVWRDERGPWCDVVGVFARARELSSSYPEPRGTIPVAPEIVDGSAVSPGSNAEEMTRGLVPYLEVLDTVHRVLEPRFYLEIGVRKGVSLGLARCPAVGLDPLPALVREPRDDAQVIEQTSDAFFRSDPRLPAELDLAFIDGMHWFEYALRDFMHVERRAHASTLVVIDDVLPNHPRQMERERSTRVWSGDVWKLRYCLKTYRPDLCLLTLDAGPCGLLLVAGLNPDNRALWERYNPIVREYSEEPLAGVPDGVMARTDAIDPRADVVRTFLTTLRDLRAEAAGVASVRSALSELVRPPAADHLAQRVDN